MRSVLLIDSACAIEPEKPNERLLMAQHSSPCRERCELAESTMVS